MNDNDTFEFENRQYVSPTVSRDEQLDFIDTYRTAMANNIDRINRETHNLGTDVPSNIGGLTGADRTFETRYVTPKVNQTVADLQAVAQSDALTQALTNLRNQYKQRYNEAYRAAKARAATSGNNNNSSEEKSKVEIETESSGGDGGTQDTTVTTDKTSGEGYINMIDNGVGQVTMNGQTYELKDLDSSSLAGGLDPTLSIGISPLKKYKNGDVVEIYGKKYYYADNEDYPGVWFEIIPDYSPNGGRGGW